MSYVICHTQKLCCMTLSDRLHGKRNVIAVQESFLCSGKHGAFAVIPLDLQGKIVKNILTLLVYQGNNFERYIDREELDKCILTQNPIVLGHKNIQDFCSVVNQCTNQKIHKCSLHDMYLLPFSQRNIITNIGSLSFCSFPKELFEDEYDAIKNMPLEKGLTINVVPRSRLVYLLNKIEIVSCICAGGGFVGVCYLRLMDPLSMLFLIPAKICFAGTGCAFLAEGLKNCFIDVKKVHL